MMKKIAFTLFAGLIFLSACASARWVGVPVFNQKNIKVSLEHRQESDKIVGQKFNHPFNLAPSDLEGLLNDLLYVEKIGMVEEVFKDQKPEPVFQADETSRLVPAIAEALAKATPDQRVRFQSVNRGGGLIFASRRITEGVIFAEPEDRFNIAFNIINHELSADEPDEVPSEYKLREPTTVKESWAVLVPMTSYAHLQELDNGKTSPVWVVADLNEFKNISKVQKTQPAAQQQEMALQPSPAEKVEESAPTKSVEQPIELSTDRNENIKNKLRLLKELFEGGLITEAEYEAEKKKILENIK